GGTGRAAGDGSARVVAAVARRLLGAALTGALMAPALRFGGGPYDYFAYGRPSNGFGVGLPPAVDTTPSPFVPPAPPFPVEPGSNDAGGGPSGSDTGSTGIPGGPGISLGEAANMAAQGPLSFPTGLNIPGLSTVNPLALMAGQFGGPFAGAPFTL